MDEHDEHEQLAAATEPDDDSDGVTGEAPPVGEYRLSTG
jgi:hypothetical protein